MPERHGPTPSRAKIGGDVAAPALALADLSGVDFGMQVVEASPDGLLIADGSGRMVLVNRRLLDLFGYQREELLGLPIEVLVPEHLRDRHVNHRERFHDAPHVRPMGAGLNLRGLRRDGTTFPVEISLSPLRGHGGYTYVVATVRDVTERVNAEALLRESEQLIAVLDERERIARDLHDKVIGRVFALGLTLQASLEQPEPAMRARVERATDDVDQIIHDLRTAVFALNRRRSEAVSAVSLRAAVLDCAAESSRVLGFEPTLTFTGPVDALATSEITAEVLDVVREALANVVRHAHARSVSISVDAHEVLELVIVDDGRGMDSGPLLGQSGGAGNGLRNIVARAERLGGSAQIRSELGVGTTIEWRVPLDR